MADDKYDSDQRSMSMVHNGSSETVDDDALLAELG